jgi:fatty-acyl-CoA synthase
VDAENQLPTIADRALYICRSGTTGLPKAAIVSHFRLMQWSYWFAGLIDTRSSDWILNCLPMYHSVDGVIAIGALLVSGGSVVTRPKFSATHFWTSPNGAARCFNISANYAVPGKSAGATA